MPEVFQDDAPDAQKEAVLKKAGFSRAGTWTMSAVKETLMTALKGAVILGLVAATFAIIPAAPAGLLAGLTNWASGAAWAPGSAIMSSIAMNGAIAGAIAGGMIGLVKGIGGADEAVEEKEQMILSKYHRAQQLASNDKMMKMSMANNMQARPQNIVGGGGYGIQPQNQLPQGMGGERQV